MRCVNNAIHLNNHSDLLPHVSEAKRICYLLFMLNNEMDQLTPSFPPGFQRDFDAHIYYHPEDREVARMLRERAQRELRAFPIFVSPLVDEKVGPHPTPMFEICFSTELIEKIRTWLILNRGDLPVLIHTVTGNDPRDHSIGAQWLGEPVELDFSKLDPAPPNWKPEQAELY
jgi:aromatic ring-cleaving dioxygenase